MWGFDSLALRMEPIIALILVSTLMLIWHYAAGIKKGLADHTAQFVRNGVVFTLFVWVALLSGVELWRTALMSVALFVFFGNALFQCAINYQYYDAFFTTKEERCFDMNLFGEVYCIRKLFYGGWRLLQILIGVVLFSVAILW